MFKSSARSKTDFYTENIYTWNGIETWQQLQYMTKYVLLKPLQQVPTLSFPGLHEIVFVSTDIYWGIKPLDLSQQVLFYFPLPITRLKATSECFLQVVFTSSLFMFAGQVNFTGSTSKLQPFPVYCQSCLTIIGPHATEWAVYQDNGFADNHLRSTEKRLFCG